MNNSFKSIDQYIALFPKDVQVLLTSVRDTIKKVAPTAEEVISYQMPTFKLNGNLVHFAAYKNHIGFYPTPLAIDAFQEQLKPYKFAKRSIQFPIDKPIPLELIRKIVLFRVKQNSEKLS
ncbi:MAG: DUF1801 domain-containing protein [Candidatus Roizmanbacteria bacterium]